MPSRIAHGALRPSKRSRLPSGRVLGAVLALVATSMLSAVGCIDTDPAVFVEATVTDPYGSVEQETLGTAVRGAFDLSLHLGPRASDASTVGLGTVALLSADRAETLVEVLAVEPDRPFPVTVPVDGDVVVTVTFDAEDNLFEASTYDTLCAAGSAVVSIALDDSLRGGTFSAVSAPFALNGCP